MNNKDYEIIENRIAYCFNNRDLLQQAFVRRSYSKENGGENNEILELIGDKALGFAVAKLLATKYGYITNDSKWNEYANEHSEGKLTQIISHLVGKKNLSARMDDLDFSQYLIMGKGDTKNNIGNEPSVKEDLFEAIVGAVVIDSDWNIEEIENVVDAMLQPDSILDQNEINYVQEVQDWCLKEYGELPVFEYLDRQANNTYFHMLNNPFGCHRYGCQFKLPNIYNTFSAGGNSKSEARKNACLEAYEYLDNNDMLWTIRDEIDCPNKNEAINQLETLARRGYFSIPEYEFYQEYDKNGNPIWSCECYIDEAKYYYSAKSNSKKNAKKQAAFDMLKYVLEEF